MDQLASHKHNYSRNDFNWEKNKTKLMNEVDNIIISFNLQKFQEQVTKEVFEPPIHTNDIPNNDNNDTVTLVEVILQKKHTYENVLKELPKLSKTQRRTSLDLMHSRPSLDMFNHKRTSSFSKPALASTSNVNVLTKAEINSPSKKFDLSLIIPKKRVTGNTDADKRSRRISLVGENLPHYIKDQLTIESEKHDKTVHKKKSRMNNLLANSQSLYAHKDISSLKSNTNTSDFTNSAVDESDDDKEYISPNLLTKYYDIEEEEEEGEDIDFVNVDDSYISENDNDNDPEGEQDDQDDQDDDDYLFNI